jgi:hypothetical protein
MHFAEFLNADSSERLRILSSPTCVGLRYGPPGSILRDYFSARRLCALPPPVGGLARGSPRPPDLPGGLIGSPFRPGLPSPGCASPYASSHRNPGRCGNVDPLPIGYGSRPRLRGRLTLGQITFTLETSGFRRTGIPPVFSLLMPAFSLAPRPRALAGPASSAYAMLSYRRRPRLRPAASVARLAPLHYRRTTTRPVSCYALFEGVAASEPTSWLSVQSYFLSHSARLGDLSRRSGLFPSRRRPLSAAV